MIELLIVLSILSMLAGVVLPSASVLMNKSHLETLVHHASVLCRETFERAVFSGKKYRVVLDEKRRLVVSYFENSRWVDSTDFWLRPLTIAENITLEWPKDGWQVLPEGYCESPKIRFHDKLSNETAFIKIRAYDAHFERQ